MIKKFDIIRAARSIVFKNKGYRLPALIHPQRDWWLGIFFFALIVGVGGAILAQMYMVNDSLDTLIGVEADKVPRYRQEVVTDALDVYRARAASYQAFVTNSPILPLTTASTSTSTTEQVIDLTREEGGETPEELTE